MSARILITSDHYRHCKQTPLSTFGNAALQHIADQANTATANMEIPTDTAVSLYAKFTHILNARGTSTFKAMEMNTGILTRMEGYPIATNIDAYDHCMSVVSNAKILASRSVDG